MHVVLVEGTSRRSDQQMSGRTCTNKRVIVSTSTTAAEYNFGSGGGGGSGGGVAGGRGGGDRVSGVLTPWSSRTVDVDIKPGDYVAVRIERANASTLIGTPLGRTSLLRFHAIHGASFTPPPMMHQSMM